MSFVSRLESRVPLKALTRAHRPRTAHTPLHNTRISPDTFVRDYKGHKDASRTRAGREAAEDARGSPMPRTDFRLSHTAHRAPPAVSPRDQNRRESRTQAMRQGRTGSRCARRTLLPPQLHLLLLEVSPVLLVDEHQVEEVFDRELVVNVLERGCQVVEPACVQAHTSVGARGRASRRGWPPSHRRLGCRALTRQGRVGSGWTRPGRARLATVGRRRVECGSRELGGNAQRATCDRVKAASAKQGWSACGRAERLQHRP